MNQRPVIFVTFKDVQSIRFDAAYDMLTSMISDTCTDISPVVKKYDVPLSNAQEMDDGKNGFYTSMLDVIRGIMSNALNDNEHLEFSVVTGCLRIAKEGIFTGTNNFSSYSVLDDRFSTSFGFTDDETHTMLDAAGLSESEDTIREWYDGYVFGNSYLYCPWDVTKYISDLTFNPKSKPKNYWKYTSHNGVLLSFAKRKDFNVKDKFEILLNGGTIEQKITDVMTYDSIHLTEDNLWSVLLMTGWDGDEHKAEKIIFDLLFSTISYNDYHEDYYHAFLTGIFVGLGYAVESNKEMGLGRTDIVLKDQPNRRAIIIEAKRSKSESDMEKDCEEAKEQILKNKYAASLTGYRQILCYGVAFFQKEAKARKL